MKNHSAPQSHLFYAAFVPPEVHPSIAALQARAVSGWKHTQSQQLHVTLAFLGEGSQYPMSQLLEAGRQVASHQPAFEATLRGTGFFPLEGSPRVWFLKAEAPGFEQLAAGLQRALGFTLDHSFHPHLTLARKRSPGPKPPTAALNLGYAVTQFSLVRSFLERGGSRYKILEKFYLVPPDRREPQPESPQPGGHP